MAGIRAEAQLERRRLLQIKINLCPQSKQLQAGKIAAAGQLIGSNIMKESSKIN